MPLDDTRALMPSLRGKIDTKSLALEIGVSMAKFLTGREHLHYGLWEGGLEPCAGNLLEAQQAYTRKLLGMLPPSRLSVLDVGGGAGETARDLSELGHEVEIVVPSAFLAERCVANAPSAAVHHCRFEEFDAGRRFDIVLFSESFQYIPIDVALGKSAEIANGDGSVLIADCFRTEAFGQDHSPDKGLVGGGHRLSAFRAAIAESPFGVVSEADVTEGVAPSVELEQDFLNLIGRSLRLVDGGLKAAFPLRHGIAAAAFRAAVGRRKRARLGHRLHGRDRSKEAFCKYNRYLFLRLSFKSGQVNG